MYLINYWSDTSETMIVQWYSTSTIHKFLNSAMREAIYNILNKSGIPEN
jgi:hypothetical protein